MYEPQTTAARIKSLASGKGLTITDLQKKCGLSQNVISQSAKSSQGIKAKNLYLIAEVLECSVDYLLGRTDEPNICSTNIKITGNNNNSINGLNNSNNIRVGSTVSEHDSITQQIIEIFNNLSFADKARVIIFFNDLAEKNK